MGSFPGTCAFSGLSIMPGQEAVLFFLEHKPDYGQAHFYHWRTITPPVFCTYMDHGHYKPTEPAWYVDAVLDSVTVDLVPAHDGKFDRWDAVTTELDNLFTCAVRRDVFDLLLAQLNPHEVHVLGEYLKQDYPAYRAAEVVPCEDVVSLSTFIAQRMLMWGSSACDEALVAQMPLSFYLAFGQRGRCSHTHVLKHFVVPVLHRRATQMEIMLRSLQMWDALDTLMWVTQRPWRPSCHAGPQEGNASILGPIFLGLAKLALEER